jgi:hypothetical protein
MVMDISGISNANISQVFSDERIRKPPEQKLAELFQLMDTNGTGTITRAQFKEAFEKSDLPPEIKAMGADAVFDKLDPNGTGSVSKQDFINGMKSLMPHHHHHHTGKSKADGSQSSPDIPSAQTLAEQLQSLLAPGNSSESTPDKTTGTIIDTTA